MRAALMAADNGIRPATGRTTVAAWLEEWLTSSVEPRNRPRTVASYRETVSRYLDPSIGRIGLTRLEPADVATMLRRPSTRGLSPTTVRYAHAVLRIALGRAVRSGRVVRNVASLVEPPARRTAERRPLTADQARSFLAAVADDRMAGLYVLAITTGMRQGELLALRWQDIDLDAGRLTVRHTLRLGTRELAEPKTERARRTLRLGSDTVVALRERRRRQLEERLAAGRKWVDGDFVFATSTGTPLDSRNVTKAFQRTLHRPAFRTSGSTICDTRARRCSSRTERNSVSCHASSGIPRSPRRRTSTPISRQPCSSDLRLAWTPSWRVDPRPHPADGGTAWGTTRIERPSGSPGGPISCVGWWPARRDSNPRPTDPKSVALIH